ncbi:DUF2158 domain-containing protein [Vibrio crassostreae]|nr:DUF2158 domain-containing protein [Vibrio crassostreae]
MSFEKGDIIKLVSGGPKMSVQHVNSKETAYGGMNAKSVRSQWFAGSTLKSGMFPFESIVKVENDDK